MGTKRWKDDRLEEGLTPEENKEESHGLSRII